METNVKGILAKRWEVGAEHYAKGLRNQGIDQYDKWLELIQNLVPNEPKLNVLDVGTGPGIMALLFGKLGHHTTGLDLSESMLAIAKENGEKAGIDCEFIQGDAEDLPFEDESFDLVVNRLNLWTLPNPGRGVYQWARVLRPQGKLYIIANDYETPIPEDPTARENDEIFTKEYYESFTNLPFRHATAAQIKALLEAAGLVNIDITPLHNIENKKRDVPFCIITGEKQ
ncbi:class I SAM-dependent methyltransferase [Halobacillus sp. B29]|uniref:class I SAM-dependent methyltransferase n=1 Tax=Halobacillus sp. B29 TaxID=3457432 RepID=UPI003FCE1395